MNANGIKGKEAMTNPMEANTQTNVETIREVWKKIITNPEAYINNYLEKESETRLAFTAGGGLPTTFGDETNQIWRDLVASMQNDHVVIAGIDFSKPELQTLGNFYRFLKDQGIKLHCIDERCINNQEHSATQVHEARGACAAVAAAIKAGIGQEVDIEKNLHQMLDETSAKQPIHPKMTEHDTITVLISFGGATAVKSEKFEELRAAHALPFNVSLPLDELQHFIDAQTLSDDASALLIHALAKWNAQIAHNIIDGHHNALHNLGDQTMFVLDQRGVPAELADLQGKVLAALKAIERKQIVSIN